MTDYHKILAKYLYDKPKSKLKKKLNHTRPKSMSSWNKFTVLSTLKRGDLKLGHRGQSQGHHKTDLCRRDTPVIEVEGQSSHQNMIILQGLLFGSQQITKVTVDSQSLINKN